MRSALDLKQRVSGMRVVCIKMCLRGSLAPTDGPDVPDEPLGGLVKPVSVSESTCVCVRVCV